MKIGNPHARRRPGATLVETAMVLIVALTLTLAIYEYCRYFMLSELVNNAAREGARLAVVSTNTQNTAAIQNTVYKYLANQSLMNTSGKAFSASDVLVYQVNPATGAKTVPDSNWYDAAFGSSIMVRVNAKFNPMLPTFGFLPTTVNLRGTAVMSSEAN
jgi:Flp pilus assembly protein TadG